MSNSATTCARWMTTYVRWRMLRPRSPRCRHGMRIGSRRCWGHNGPSRLASDWHASAESDASVRRSDGDTAVQPRHSGFRRGHSAPTHVPGRTLCARPSVHGASGEPPQRRGVRLYSQRSQGQGEVGGYPATRSHAGPQMPAAARTKTGGDHALNRDDHSNAWTVLPEIHQNANGEITCSAPTAAPHSRGSRMRRVRARTPLSVGPGPWSGSLPATAGRPLHPVEDVSPYASSGHPRNGASRMVRSVAA